MAFAIAARKIHCPNCHFEGKAKIKGSGCALWLVWLVIFLVSFLFWPLLIVAGLMFIWLVFKGAAQVCPKCGWANPVPLSQYMKTTVQGPRPAGAANPAPQAQAQHKRPPAQAQAQAQNKGSKGGRGLPAWVKTKEDYEKWKQERTRNTSASEG